MTLDELLAAARVEDPTVRVGASADAFWSAVLAELRRFFAGRVPSYDADELVQDCVDVVLRRLDEYQPRGHDTFVRWLRVIAANHHLAWQRAPQRERMRKAKLLAQPSATPLLSPSGWALLRERGGLLEEHKQRLPAHELRALEHELSGGDDRALARREGVALPTVRSRRWRARVHVARSIAGERRTPL